MTQLAIGSFLLGAVFGLRFKVLILVPIMLIGFMIAVAVAIVAHQSFLQALLVVVVCSCALQAGYLLGSLVRLTTAAGRAARTSVTPAKAVRSA